MSKVNKLLEQMQTGSIRASVIGLSDVDKEIVRSIERSVINHLSDWMYEDELLGRDIKVTITFVKPEIKDVV